MRRAGVVAPYESNRGHPRLTVAVIIIAAVQRALREAPLRRYRQRLPCSRSFGGYCSGDGADRVVRPYERLSSRFTIQPYAVVVVAGVGGAEPRPYEAV